ncbi:calcium-binding protein [Nocardioides sp.]|uniref:calcium-binding protein n=1 Tax=Nocardioides sp. TaxID=35761 RepID=UPI001A2C3D2E|nr:calcium-binding protein [Nocardioides sp.]MBJ7355993.1 hypothetical protein [Nocardioides sp.]
MTRPRAGAAAALALATGLLVVPATPDPAVAAAAATCGGEPATMVLGDGDDEVTGTAGDDVVVLGGGNDSYDDPGGNDVVCAGDGEAFIRPGDGDDRVYGGTGRTYMIDDAGTDYYDGEQSEASLTFDGRGVDIRVAEGHERGNGDDAFARIASYSGTAGADRFVGSDAPETFQRVQGNDVVRLGGGDDLVQVFSNRGKVFGGAGDDYVDVARLGRKGVISTGPGSDLVMFGEPSKARVRLGTGADVFEGNDGWARVDGGPGPDALWLDSATRGVLVDAGAGTARYRGRALFHFSHFEGWSGTGFDDVLRGSPRADSIDGQSGDDVMIGLGGNDRLIGWDGHDTADGGPGVDRCHAELAASCEEMVPRQVPPAPDALRGPGVGWL